jgi:signal peptidase I
VPPNPDAPPQTASPETGPAPVRSRRIPRWLIEWTVVVIAAVLVAVLVRTFVAQTFYIPSASMEPTLQIGDRIVVNKLSYHLHGVNRGDIIVFRRPPSENCGGPTVPDLVKRVIGLPGERVSSQGNTVLINGKPLAEPWLPKGDPLGQAIQPITVPQGEYFVMGDNRSDSCDSRDWGPLPSSYIVGHVVLRIWPLSRIGLL